MPIVKRLVRPDPFEVVTEDGYHYLWPEGGEAVDVLEHHRRPLLAMKGSHLVDVEVDEVPTLQPLFRVSVPIPLATVPAPEREPDPDLTGAYIDPATVEDDLPAALPVQPDPAPATLVPAITDVWSDADKRALMARLADELGDG